MRLAFIIILLAMSEEIYSQTIPLVYKESQIDVGTLYEYELSKSEVYDPQIIFIYFASETEINVLKKGSSFTYLEKYVFNWNTMMLQGNTVKLVGHDESTALNKLPLHALVSYDSQVDFEKKTVRTQQKNKGENGIDKTNKIIKYENIPSYFYAQTEGLDLWHAMRFFPMDTQKEVVVHEVYREKTIEVKVEYEGKEDVQTRNETITCSKFKMYPNSFFWKLFAKDVTIWLADQKNSHHFMVKYVNENPLNPFQPRCEYRFLSKKTCTLDQWNSLINTSE